MILETAFGFGYEQRHEHRDYHNYSGEDEAALRKLQHQVFEAFQSSELWKAFFVREGVRRIEVRRLISNQIASQFWAKMGFKPYMETLFLTC